MDVKIKTDVATEPVDSAFINNYLKIEPDATEQALITEMVKAAREAIEGITQRALAQKTFVVEFGEDDIYDDEFELPFAPISSVTSLLPVDNEGTEGTALVLNEGYYVQGQQQKSIRVAVSLLVAESDYLSTYRVEYIAGYGAANCNALPSALKLSIAELVNLWYFNRGLTGNVPSSIREKVYPYIQWSEV